MSGDIFFDNLGGKSWTVRNAAFRVILGTALACYLDAAGAPTFAQFCRGVCGPWLHEYWPDRYPVEQTELYLLVMDERIPRAEYPAIIEALEKLADGFEHETIDPRVAWGGGDLVGWTQELVEFMRESLAAPERPASGDGNRPAA
jgi:hypothetical protein